MLESYAKLMETASRELQAADDSLRGAMQG